MDSTIIKPLIGDRVCTMSKVIMKPLKSVPVLQLWGLLRHSSEAQNISPDLNLIEMLWRGLQTAVQKWMPANVNEMKQHCKV